MTGFESNAVLTPQTMNIPNIGPSQVATIDGWIIIQQRLDNTLDFYQAWNYYKSGFGNYTDPSWDSYWMGLESVYQLTNVLGSVYRLRLEFWDGTTWYTDEYSTFSIESEASNYRLHVSSTSCGSAGNLLNYDCNGGGTHNGMTFVTYDKANSGENCDSVGYGGWWFTSYDYCMCIHLNGWASTFSARFPSKTRDTTLFKSRMMIARVAWS